MIDGHRLAGHQCLSIGYIMICLSNLPLMNSQKGSNFCYKHYKCLYSFSDVTWRHISRSRRSEGPFETINRIQVNPLEGSSSRIQNFFLRSHHIRAFMVQNTLKSVFLREHHYAWLQFQCNVVFKTFMVLITEVIYSAHPLRDLPYFVHTFLRALFTLADERAATVGMC